MDKGLGQGMTTSEGVHLYHEDKPAVVAYTAAQVEAYKADGYTEEYAHREYPKFLAKIGKTAKDAAHEAELLAETALETAVAVANPGGAE